MTPGPEHFREPFTRGGNKPEYSTLGSAEPQRQTYVSGVGHMTAPEDVIDCCPFGPGHPIHEVRLAP